MTRFPHSVRRPSPAYGSATLALSQRVGPGSTFTSEDVDITRDEVKSFGFRGNIQGSWYVQVAFGGTNQYFTLAQGTFPAGFGTIKAASFTEAYRRARGRVRLSAAGSVSLFYGGLSTFG